MRSHPSVYPAPFATFTRMLYQQEPFPAVALPACPSLFPSNTKENVWYVQFIRPKKKNMQFSIQWGRE
jgi:hypothetical protein